MRIALAQINTTVGDLNGNRERIVSAIGDARRLGADLVAFPEMAITGYPAEDLLLQPDFVREAGSVLDEIVLMTTGLTAIIGAPLCDGNVYNSAAVMHDGRLAVVYRKQWLPTYGVFDETRYFLPAASNLTFKLGETVFGVSICEDIWYPDGPPHLQANEGGATLLINISASPYHINKGEVRERMLATRAADTLTFVAYCNLVGGQDELVFDGQSMIFGPQGEILARAAQFTEDMLVADIDTLEVLRARLVDRRRSSAGRSRFEQVSLAQVATRSKRPLHPCLKAPLARAAESYEALKLATRDYVLKNGFHKVVLGLSGGIDSSLVAAIAADALGPENVTGVAMPTRYSSEHSIEDARQLADNFGLHFLTIPIDATFESFLQMLAPACGEIRGLPEENIQPRIRGTVLMALSNHFGWLVLTTGNKSENSVGYSTLYGDTAGGFAVIKDVSKMLVYELARHRNQIAGHDVIPERVLTKAPSAELRPDQKDSDSLPEYEVLDPILRAYVEERCSAEEIVLRGFASDVVARVIRLVQISEYKRRQSPPGVKITPRAFGKDWRLPITKSIARATHRAG